MNTLPSIMTNDVEECLAVLWPHVDFIPELFVRFDGNTGRDERHVEGFCVRLHRR